VAENKIPDSASALLLVEGIDDVRFFAWLKSKLNTNDAIYIYQLQGGKATLTKNLNLLAVDPNFNKIQKIGIILDTDDSPESTLQSMRDSVRGANIDADKVAVFRETMPPQNSGVEGRCLEDVLWAYFVDAGLPHIDCTENYIACIQKLSDTPITKIPQDSQLSKARYYALIATFKKPVHVDKSQQAISQYIKNHESPVFADLKAFLQKLLPE